MAAQNSPFVEATYGWPYGSNGWNTEMDLNLVKFSYLHDRNIDAIVSSLPAIVNGKAYFNTSDNRLYFDANGQRYSSVTPKWFEVTLRTTGQVYQFDGAALNLGSTETAYTDELRTDLASVTGASNIGYENRDLESWLDDFPNASSYSGATAQAIMTSAIVALNAAGGGTLNIPRSAWVFSGEVLATITSPIVLNFMGGTLNQTVDANIFNLTLSGGGSINFAGSIDITCSFAANSTSSAIIRVVGSGNLRDFVITGILRYRAGGTTSQFKYGINAIGVQDPDARGLLLFGAAGIPAQHTIAMHLVNGVGQASTSWKIWGPSSYNMKTGLEIISTSYPGVEGIKIMAGDFVSCDRGIVCDASASGYVPPQFEIVSCHVNSFGECLTVKGVLNVKVIGGLLYRQGAGTTAPFIDLTDCQDIAIVGGSLHCITAGLDIPGIIARGVVRPIAFMRVDCTHFWLNALAQPCIKLIGDISRFSLGGSNTRATGATWLDITGVTSGKSGIVVSPELSSTSNDSVRTSITPVAGVLDLRDSLTPNILLAGVISSTVITSILGRKGWTYDIRSDVAGVSYTPSAGIAIGGATLNFAYYIAGSFISFFMEGDTSARYIGGTISKSLRDPIVPVQNMTFATGSLPSAALNGSCWIFVTGIAAYRIAAYSDGSVWRRGDDNSVTVT